MMMTATDMINALTAPAGAANPLPSRLDSDHASPRPALAVVLDRPAHDPELLARVRAGLLRL